MFLRTKFLRFSNFTAANFKNAAAFGEAVFEDDCMFDDAYFEGRTFFVDVKFMKLAKFASAIFGSSTSFNSTNFASAEKPAIFTGIKADREIDLSGCAFASVPAFNCADFEQAPDLDYVKFPLPTFWRAGKQEPTLDIARSDAWRSRPRITSASRWPSKAKSAASAERNTSRITPPFGSASPMTRFRTSAAPSHSPSPFGSPRYRFRLLLLLERRRRPFRMALTVCRGRNFEGAESDHPLRR